MIGRLVEDSDQGTAIILHAFPWRGEQVRLALPTGLPPTLASWMLKRDRGTTDGQRFWQPALLAAAQARARFVRAALAGALEGLETVHAAGLLHQGLSPSAVLVSTEDDR